MSAALMFALLLQVTAIVLLRHRLGKGWLRRPGTLLVLTAVVYIGISPVLLSFGSIRYWDSFRAGVQQSYVDEATLIMSAGMLAFTICYLLTKPEQAMAVPGEPDIGSRAAQALDWRLLALALLPLAALTYEGRGYNGTAVTAPGAPVVPELASGFFVILVVLTAYSIALRHGRFLLVLAAQSLLLAAAGERAPVLVAAITLTVMLASAGRGPSPQQVQVAGALAVVAVLAITGVRAEKGRAVFSEDTGLGARVSTLASSVSGAAATPAGQPGLLAQAADRLDGVDFAAAILQAEHMGQPRLSTIYMPESLLIAVPSSLWSSKGVHAQALTVVNTEERDFGLLPVNFLPGLAGMYFGALSPAWLIALLAVAGLLAGRAERWLLRCWTPVRVVFLAGAVFAALDYEQGLQGMVLDLRSAAVIGAAVKLAEMARARKVGGYRRRHFPEGKRIPAQALPGSIIGLPGASATSG